MAAAGIKLHPSCRARQEGFGPLFYDSGGRACSSLPLAAFSPPTSTGPYGAGKSSPPGRPNPRRRLCKNPLHNSWKRDFSVSNKYVEMGMRSPVNLTWEVTLACNLRCSHCLSSSGEAACNELSTAEALDLVEQLHTAGVFQVNFGGGEPFIRPDFERSWRPAIPMASSPASPPTAPSSVPERVARLASNRLVAIQVSLDGATRETCDAIRGDGVFDAAIEAVKLLAATSIPTSINTVLTAQNAAEIPVMHELARSLGVSLPVSRFRPSGRGADNGNASSVTGAADRLFRLACRQRRRGPAIAFFR